MTEQRSAETSTRHTPGPWKAASARSFIVGLPIVATNGRTIANSHQPGDEGMANARLIAAAPELLDALRRLVARDFTYYGGFVTDCNISMDEVRRARDAIALAETQRSSNADESNERNESSGERA